MGEALAVADGAKWKRKRRLLTGSFHFDVLRKYTVVFNDCVEVLLDKMGQVAAQGAKFDVYHRGLVLCSYDTILRTAFSYKSDCQVRVSAYLLREGKVRGYSNFNLVVKTFQRVHSSPSGCICICGI